MEGVAGACCMLLSNITLTKCSCRRCKLKITNPDMWTVFIPVAKEAVRTCESSNQQEGRG